MIQNPLCRKSFGIDSGYGLYVMPFVCVCVYEMMWLIFCKVHRSEVNKVLYIHPEDQD